MIFNDQVHPFCCKFADLRRVSIAKMFIIGDFIRGLATDLIEVIGPGLHISEV